MSRVSGSLARRIDRLSRSAHRFHRFAHHPLCSEYAGELVQLGRRTRICRGCSFVALGGLAGLVLSVFVPVSTVTLAGLFAGSWGWLAFATFRRSRRSGRRTPKLSSRLVPALGVAFGLGHALRMGPVGWASIACTLFCLGAVVAFYRRRGPDRSPCAVCPERHLETPCRGLMPIVRRERAFQRLAGQWMSRQGV